MKLNPEITKRIQRLLELRSVADSAAAQADKQESELRSLLASLVEKPLVTGCTFVSRYRGADGRDRLGACHMTKEKTRLDLHAVSATE